MQPPSCLQFLLRNQLNNLWAFPCMLFVAFSIFYLSLFYWFDYHVSQHVPLGLSYLGLCFLDLGDCFLSHVREVFSYCFFNYVLRPFLFLFSFLDPYSVILLHLILSQRSLKSFSFLFILYFLFCSVAVFLPCLPAHLSVLLPHLFCSWFLPVIVHLCLFFISSRSLFSISCIFLVCASILFPRS